MFKYSDGFQFSYIRSSEDISSGYSTQYSSAEPVSMALSRTSSLTNATRCKSKTKRTEVSGYNTFEKIYTNSQKQVKYVQRKI